MGNALQVIGANNENNYQKEFSQLGGIFSAKRLVLQHFINDSEVSWCMH